MKNYKITKEITTYPSGRQDIFYFVYKRALLFRWGFERICDDLEEAEEYIKRCEAPKPKVIKTIIKYL